MSRLILPPSPLLADIVRYFHIERADGGELLMPAMPFPYVGALLRGHTLSERDGERMASPRSFAVGALSRPVRLHIEPETVFISAPLRIGRLQTLFGVASHQLTDRIWPLEALIGREEEESLFDSLRLRDGPLRWTEALSEWMRTRLARREAAGGLDDWRLPAAALFLDGRTLAERSGLSMRQFERRFLARYGQTLRDMRRMARFMNAMGGMILNGGNSLAGLALDCGYFDQAHLSRDFKLLSGYTPREFAQGIRASGGSELDLMRYGSDERRLVMGSVSADLEALLPGLG
ncbi:helix-turn-helix domain-containing protein [Chromobacterium sp. CV08]|uniref:helix-turn-helix domain-containing protein n=1 Tax=Chromobacterium sp. CV08 TaxID=3133274 RepID=UPI003DA7C1C3